MLAPPPPPRSRRRLTPAQRALLSCVRRAGGLMRVDGSQGASYALPGGPPVHRRTVDALVAKGWLVPNRDSLFDGPSQTYRAPAPPPPVRRSPARRPPPDARPCPP